MNLGYSFDMRCGIKKQLYVHIKLIEVTHLCRSWLVLLNKVSNLEVVKTPLSADKINDYIVVYLCHCRTSLHSGV